MWNKHWFEDGWTVLFRGTCASRLAWTRVGFGWRTSLQSSTFQGSPHLEVISGQPLHSVKQPQGMRKLTQALAAYHTATHDTGSNAKFNSKTFFRINFCPLWKHIIKYIYTHSNYVCLLLPYKKRRRRKEKEKETFAFSGLIPHLTSFSQRKTFLTRREWLSWELCGMIGSVSHLDFYPVGFLVLWQHERHIYLCLSGPEVITITALRRSLPGKHQCRPFWADRQINMAEMCKKPQIMIGEKNRRDDGKGGSKIVQSWFILMWKKKHLLHTADLHCALIPAHFLYYSLTELLTGNMWEP